MLRWPTIILATATLAGCAFEPREDVAAMVAAAVPPTEDVRARVAAEGRGLLLSSYDLQGPEISFVGTTATGDRWVCVRALAGSPAEGLAMRQAIAVLSADALLIGTQTNCPTCAEPGLRWLPFPELAVDAWAERPPFPG